MKKEASKDLIQKYNEGKCTSEELNQVEDWYNSTAEQNSGTPFNQNMIIQEQARLEEIWPSRQNENKLVQLYRGYRNYSVAALILICASFGIYLMITGRNDSTFDHSTFEHDINPGKNKAVITLTDGTKINVTDAKQGLLSAKSGIQVTKTGDGEITFKFQNSKPSNPHKNLFNTIETPRGGEYKVCLPDGSMIWLNAASTLTFSANLVNADRREVRLSGEAYFKVKKDKIHPFVVFTAKQQVMVLGTHFNVSSYPEDAAVKTTLLEGSVKVTSDRAGINHKETSVILKPDEQAVNNGALVTVKKVQAEKEIAWHNGRFTFNDEPLRNIMQKLARWYDLKVIYQDEAVQYKTVAGSASRYAKISDILGQLELTGQVHFKIKGKEITVMN